MRSRVPFVGLPLRLVESASPAERLVLLELYLLGSRHHWGSFRTSYAELVERCRSLSYRPLRAYVARLAEEGALELIRDGRGLRILVYRHDEYRGVGQVDVGTSSGRREVEVRTRWGRRRDEMRTRTYGPRGPIEDLSCRGQDEVRTSSGRDEDVVGTSSGRVPTTPIRSKNRIDQNILAKKVWSLANEARSLERGWGAFAPRLDAAIPGASELLRAALFSSQAGTWSAFLTASPEALPHIRRQILEHLESESGD